MDKIILAVLKSRQMFWPCRAKPPKGTLRGRYACQNERITCLFQKNKMLEKLF